MPKRSASTRSKKMIEQAKAAIESEKMELLLN
jgi:hypothetical protein